MTTSFYNGLGGMLSSQIGIDVIGNNIANVNTIGYKRQEAEFSALFSESLSKSNSVVTSDVGSSATVTSTAMILSQGGVQKTDSNFDLALQGKGWFALKDESNQIYYTRAGSFNRDANGELVSDDGNKLQVVNAHNLNFDGKNWKFDASVDTSHLISQDFSLDSIKLPDNVVFPAQATKNIFIAGNLSNQDIAPTPKEATIDSDFGVLYDANAQNLHMVEGNDLVFGFGDNIYYDNGMIKYPICIEDDKVDGKEVNIDFDVNGKNIKLILADGSSANDIKNMLIKEFSKQNINYKLNGDSLEIQNKDSLVIKNNNTPFINSASMKRLIYSPTSNDNNNFTTMQDFINKLNELSSGIYEGVNVSFIDGKIEIDNTSSKNIKSNLYKTSHSNEQFVNNLNILGSTIQPDRKMYSLTFKQNYQSFENQIIDSNGNKNNLKFEFYKTKIEGDTTIWKLVLTQTDIDGNVVSSKEENLRFDKIGGLINPTEIEFNNNGIKTKIDLGGNFRGITSLDKPNTGYVYSQDGFEEGYLEGYDISDEGYILAHFSNSRTGTLGQIPIYHFANEQGLDSVLSNKYIPTNNSGEAFVYRDNNGNYISGAKIENYGLEMSNVDVGNAMTELIVMQKSFEANSKSITTSDQMIQKAIEMKR